MFSRIALTILSVSFIFFVRCVVRTEQLKREDVKPGPLGTAEQCYKAAGYAVEAVLKGMTGRPNTDANKIKRTCLSVKVSFPFTDQFCAAELLLSSFTRTRNAPAIFLLVLMVYAKK